MECYLDTETTGPEPRPGRLDRDRFVCGWGREERVVQIVASQISVAALRDRLGGVVAHCTYNGERFDLPFIRAKLGIELKRHFGHRDLMFERWRQNFFGGLKKVERKLGIVRASAGIDGRAAAQLWFRYEHFGDRNSLARLLAYNKEDVCNLELLRQKLDH